VDQQTASDTQIKDDEMMARMLQNQLFLSELKQYPEFDPFFLFGRPRPSSPSSSSTSSENDVDVVNTIKQLGTGL
jgi:hypothetical protein